MHDDLTARLARAREALAVLERQPAVDARGDVVYDPRLATEKRLIQRAGHVHLRAALEALDAAEARADAAEAEVARMHAPSPPDGYTALAHAGGVRVRELIEQGRRDEVPSLTEVRPPRSGEKLR